MGAPGASGTDGAQRAVALGAAAVHRLHQEPVDLLAQLHHVGGGGPSLTALRCREHVFIQRAPGDGEREHLSTLGRHPSVDVAMAGVELWSFNKQSIIRFLISMNVTINHISFHSLSFVNTFNIEGSWEFRFVME